jgi:hypothetical protein
MGASAARASLFVAAGACAAVFLVADASRAARLRERITGKLDDLEAAAGKTLLLSRYEEEERPQIEASLRRLEEKLPLDPSPAAWRSRLLAWASEEGVVLTRCWTGEAEPWSPPFVEGDGAEPTEASAADDVSEEDGLGVRFECIGVAPFEPCVRFLARVLAADPIVVPTGLAFGGAAPPGVEASERRAIDAFLPPLPPDTRVDAETHVFSLRGRVLGHAPPGGAEVRG